MSTIMQSVLISGQIEKTREKAQAICLENKISKFDIEIIQTEKTAGIGDIRNLQKKLFLKPIKGEKKAVILEAFLGMTIDSQNAFLKVLEEPPVSTIVMILTTSLDFVLPTILSRCNLINLDKIKKLSDEEIKNFFKIILELKDRGFDEALIIAQDNSKNKEIALQFLENLLISAHYALENQDSEISIEDLGNVLKNLQKTYTIIKNTNVTPRFALENLFLNLYSTN
jgi:DNA polymerase III delta prime subunit